MSDHCPDCGSELEDFVEGSSMGQRCPSCGWSLVTTFTPPILVDERDYIISLLPGNETSPGALRAVSRLLGCNYVAAKRALAEGARGNSSPGERLRFSRSASNLSTLGWRWRSRQVFPITGLGSRSLAGVGLG